MVRLLVVFRVKNIFPDESKWRARSITFSVRYRYSYRCCAKRNALLPFGANVEYETYVNGRTRPSAEFVETTGDRISAGSGESSRPRILNYVTTATRVTSRADQFLETGGYPESVDGFTNRIADSGNVRPNSGYFRTGWKRYAKIAEFRPLTIEYAGV